MNATDQYAHYDRGLCYQMKRQDERALADYDEAARLDPNHALAHNAVAWLRSTCPLEGVRDGRRAIEHARRACELTGWNEADYFDTLAAAYAEAGHFDEAVRWQQKALDSPGFAAKDRNREEEIKKAQARLNLYRQRKPYRDE